MRLVLLFLACCSCIVFAQVPHQMLSVNRPLTLLEFAMIVREELKLTEDQIEKLKAQEVNISLAAQLDAFDENVTDGDPSRNNPRSPRKHVQEAHQDANQTALQVLTVEQKRRADELQFQIELRCRDPYQVLANHGFDLPNRDVVMRSIRNSQLKFQSRIAELKVRRTKPALLQVFTEAELEELMGEPFPFPRPYGLFEAPADPDRTIRYADQDFKGSELSSGRPSRR